VNLLTLGSAQRRLFAIHEPAAWAAGRVRAVVLCHPLGVEYTYAYRSMRHLALKLAVSGCHTLRFDYYGTGDSGGEESETDLPGCEFDVEVAMEAIADIAGTTKVSLVGLRGGANIAAHVAMRCAGDVEALVLWDPLTAGETYQRTAALRAVAGPLPERTALIVTQREPATEPLCQSEFVCGARPATPEFVAAPIAWFESATTTGALPVAVVQRVVEWLR
jgi:uncharacterized protein